MPIRSSSMKRTVIERYAAVNIRPLSGRHPEARIGPGGMIRSHAMVYRGAVIGADVFCGHFAVIREGCRLGDRVKIGSHTIIDPGCVLEHGATVHSGCYLGEYTQVKARAWIGPGVRTTNTLYPKCGHPGRLLRGSVIGESAVIGAGAILMPGVRIGPRALVAAGSIVTTDVPAGKLVVGSPARAVKDVASIACCPGKRYRQ